MATKEIKTIIYTCDKCKKESEADTFIRTVSVCSGTWVDAAGSTNEVYKSADLCHRCMRTILGRFIQDLGAEYSIKMLEDFIGHVMPEVK